jgi:hypothetical protein
MSYTRQNLIQKHINELLETGETICESPKIRKFIYNELQKRNLKFTKKIVQTNGEGICLRERGYSPKCLIKFRNCGSLTSDMILTKYKQYYPDDYQYEPPVSIIEINEFFDSKTSHDRSLELAIKMHGLHFLDWIYLLKTTKKIILLK